MSKIGKKKKRIEKYVEKKTKKGSAFMNHKNR